MPGFPQPSAFLNRESLEGSACGRMIDGSKMHLPG
jgi:hypothetical protein